MRFLLITLEYFPFKGGIANYYTNLAYHWPTSEQLFILNNNNHELLRRRGLFKWTKSISKLYHYIKKNKIDYVIVGHILPLGIAMYLVSKILKTRYTVILHGMDFSYATRNFWKRMISRIILKSADKIVSANSYTAKLCSDFLKNYSKISVVNPGAKDFSNFNEELVGEIKIKNNLQNHQIIFSLGRLVKRKGFDYVIRALKNIIKKNPDSNIIYLIAGRGPELEYLKKIAYDNFGDNWEKYINFIGEISEAEKWALLSLCDIFVMPSRNINGDFEGFGIVYLEANLAKKPVIAGNSGGVGDAVENGVNGLLVDSENIDEISEAILYLLENKEKRLKMGEWGRDRALLKFNWKKQVQDIYRFLTY
jgi:phosphatidylinositol alpha-1,6-mannosyltransferase